MKLRNIILMTASIAMTACSKQAVPTAIPEDAKIEQQVEELLSKMDLDAKIGQMTELIRRDNKWRIPIGRGKTPQSDC